MRHRARDARGRSRRGARDVRQDRDLRSGAARRSTTARALHRRARDRRRRHRGRPARRRRRADRVRSGARASGRTASSTPGSSICTITWRTTTARCGSRPAPIPTPRGTSGRARRATARRSACRRAVLGTAAAKAVLKFAEVKSAVAGVTSVQGSPGLSRPYEGWLVRNVEHETFGTGTDLVYQSVRTLGHGRPAALSRPPRRRRGVHLPPRRGHRPASCWTSSGT